MKKKFSNKTFVGIVVAMVLLVVLAAGSTFAWFTDKLETASKTYTFGEIDIEFGGTTTAQTVFSFERTIGDDDGAYLMPGDTITIDAVIQNNKEAAFVRLDYTLTLPTFANDTNNVNKAAFITAFTNETVDGVHHWTMDTNDVATAQSLTAVQYIALASGRGADPVVTETIDLNVIVPNTINNSAINTTFNMTLNVAAVQQANMLAAYSDASGYESVITGIYTGRDATTHELTGEYTGWATSESNVPSTNP